MEIVHFETRICSYSLILPFNSVKIHRTLEDKVVIDKKQLSNEKKL